MGLENVPPLSPEVIAASRRVMDAMLNGHANQRVKDELVFHIEQLRSDADRVPPDGDESFRLGWVAAYGQAIADITGRHNRRMLNQG